MCRKEIKCLDVETHIKQLFYFLGMCTTGQKNTSGQYDMTHNIQEMCLQDNSEAKVTRCKSHAIQAHLKFEIFKQSASLTMYCLVHCSYL